MDRKDKAQMKFLYFDATSGLSGDMILGALLDLGVPKTLFLEKMAGLHLPVDIKIRETVRSSLRGLKVDVLVKKNTNSKARKWKDVEGLITASSFSKDIKKKSLSIFKKLFQAESHVHGHSFHLTHLHEAGADDAIIDIVGCCFLADYLNIDTFYCSPLNVGQGWIKTAHGMLPVPPPAVAELLKNIPVYSAWTKNELVTPTGAAIVATLVNTFLSFPEMNYEKIGYGAGSKNFPEIPNILRAFLGKTEQLNAKKKIFSIEANIDDSTPQILAGYFEKAFKLGALDVSLTPIVMKKNRLATKLTVMAESGKLDSLIRSIFEETNSIGVRFYPVERRVLERKWAKISVLGEDITVKTACLEGREVNALPEYEDCKKVARKRKIPVKKVYEMAQTEIAQKKQKIAAIEDK
ncbi:MAG: nickel pincer cofactor biosynthesis protein LarC [Candidatus Aminicenantes bacterium]|nr:nickel pincer cofactor biosynthesis protein LarC [Candidatus Aminicenantes bacterium]